MSRTSKVAQAFSSTGVLANATKATGAEAVGDRDDFAPYWDSNGTYLDRPTYSATQLINGSSNADSAGGRILNRITLSPTAVDPEGFPLTYSVDTVPPNPTQLDSVSVTGNSFRFTPAYGIHGDSQNNAGSFKARLRASDGPRDVLDVITFSLEYTESMHVPAGTTLLLGLSFDGGAIGKSGSWGTPSGGGGYTYNTSGGVLNGGYGSNISGSVTVSELSAAGAGAGKTFIAWYKGSQTNGTNSAYSPGVPIFGHTTGSVHMGFGLEDGNIAVCGGSSLTQGTTNLATNTWRMLAFTYSSSGHIINGYCDVNGDMTKEITDKDTSSSAGYNYLNHFFNGYSYGGYQQPTSVDNVQVFDNVLTQSQIQAIFDKGGGTNGGN